jgi:DNA polymerase III epsilon subunit-like protein
MLNYTAIDFETANEYRGSPCAVGLVKVINGVVADERHWMMKPPDCVARFSPFNVAVHGITREMVATAPTWRERLPEILRFIGDDVVVAHNAGFDMGVLRYACAADEIPSPQLRFLCTLVMARRAFQLPSYRLPFVAAACGYELRDHHHPLADARGAVDIVNYLALRESAADLDALAPLLQVRFGYMDDDAYKPSRRTSVGGSAALVVPDGNPEADPSAYLFGRVVVFTGGLTSMTRQVAWNEVVRNGGIPEKATTTRTNVLVLGDFNPASLRPGATYSGKARKAFELQDTGQDIELMTEDDFLRVIEGRRIDELPPDLAIA